MKVHRFERLWLVASLVLIVAWIATVTYGAVGPGVAMVGDEGGTVADPANATESPNFREPGVYAVDGEENRYEVYVRAQQFYFQPGTNEPIRLPAGSEVTFYVTSADVIHGFELVGTNVNTMVIPGQVTEATVRFEEPGEYDIVCHEYCGAGHHTMTGDLVVVPRSEYQGGS
ncbi:MAG: cytochrome c oxidase subunit II [Haloferacaceae archaeon]